MWKILIGILLLIASFGVGYYFAPGKVVEKVVTKVDTVVHERVVTKIIERKPDGTVTETIREEVKDKKETSSTKSSQSGSPTASQPSYRVGGTYRIGSLGDAADPKWDQAGVSGGYRLVGPIWADFGLTRKDVTLGVSVSW